MRTTSSLKKMVTIALLSAIAYLIMYIAFPLPLFPTFLTIDISDIPAIIGAILFGPVAGITIEALKNLIHYLTTGSATGVPIGEIANLLAGSVLIVTSSLIYKKGKTIRSFLIGLSLGSLVMAVVMSVANYYLIFPAYAKFMGFSEETMVQLGQAANPSITNLFTLIILAVLPFNIIKGIIITLISLPLWMRLRPRLMKHTS